MNTYKKIFALLTPHERKRGLLLLVLVMGMVLLETAGVASVMPFLAVLGNPELLNTNPILSRLYTHAQAYGIVTPDHFFIALGIGTVTLMIASAAYRTLTSYAMNRYIEMRRHSICVRLLKTYLRQPYAFFIDRHSSDMSKTILSEVDIFIVDVFRPAYNMLANSLVLIAITALLLLVNPWIALLAGGLLGGLYTLLFLGLKFKLSRIGDTLVSANKERFLAAGEAFGGIKDIKLLGRELSYLSRFQRHSHEYTAAYASHAVIRQVPKYMIEAVAFGGIIGIVLVLMVSSGGLGNNILGQILPIVGLYAFAAYRLHPSFQAIFSGLASLRFGQAAIDSIYSDLERESAVADRSLTAPVPIELKHSIALQCLSYTYPKAVKPALVNLELDIPVGSTLGLVGSTGAGKTTLVDVLLGLLRPTEGSIAVDGVPVSDDQLSAWQHLLGYVPQEIFLTDTTIAENIALGIPKPQIDQIQVERCARMAQVHEFIFNDLPAQYETLVGERGLRLSGGQRQRIGIARALYHNPKVLVFDEATSALDTVTEQAVMDAIVALAHQKTIILIAHRLSTVKRCDQIVLLEHGTIKAKGTFSELVDANSQFKLMANHA